MSTPIEIVREFQLWRRADGKYASDEPPYCFIPYTPKEIGVALDAVLDDAERYKALELAHLDARVEQGWATVDARGKYWPAWTPLAELADRLREGKQ